MLVDAQVPENSGAEKAVQRLAGESEGNGRLSGKEIGKIVEDFERQDLELKGASWIIETNAGRSEVC